jgi:DAACS family dicarboxylate/amino acid:cation (Na+ or H+) symporter
VKLHARIFLGLALGLVGGTAAHVWAEGTPWLSWTVENVTSPVGKVFLRGMFMMVAPLLFVSLALGVAGLKDLKALGRLGLRTLGCTLLFSSVAVLLGVVLVNTLRPGLGLSEEKRQALMAGAAERAASLGAAQAPKGGLELLVQIVPDNPFKAAAGGDYLGLMFFALVFGMGLALAKGEGANRLMEVLEGLNEVLMILIERLIRLAPIGVFALLFSLTAEVGVDVLANLARYVVVVLLALAVHQFGVYSLFVRFLGGMDPRVFFRAIKSAMVTAFSTSSSNATLPTALRVADTELHLPPHVSRFVLTIGSTANQNGTALFEGVTVLFLAQFYGVDLTLAQQITVVVICILGGIGTAGVPSGSIPVVAMILTRVNVPPEGIGLILGVDRFLDMCRTTLNVTGDLCVAVVVARGERERAG